MISSASVIPLLGVSFVSLVVGLVSGLLCRRSHLSHITEENARLAEDNKELHVLNGRLAVRNAELEGPGRSLPKVRAGVSLDSASEALPIGPSMTGPVRLVTGNSPTGPCTPWPSPAHAHAPGVSTGECRRSERRDFSSVVRYPASVRDLEQLSPPSSRS